MTRVCGDSLGFWNSLSFVTPGALTLTSLVLVLLLAASLIAVGMDAFGRKPRQASAPASRATRPLAVLWLVVLFLITLSAKLLLMREVPVTVPFWDQWDGEAAALLVPFQHCTLTWRTMFDLHNEHRAFFTRLLALDLAVVNGQWDPRLEQVANASMHVLTAVLVAAMLWVARGRRHLDLLVLACALSFALPVSWENTLGGFQSAFYFLLLFSVLALWLTTSRPVLSWPWWRGWLCAVCGVFTAAGGGLLIAVAISGVMVLKVVDNPRAWRGPAVNVAAAATVFALGFAMAAPIQPQHAALKAATAAAFVTALGHGLAWPWVLYPLLSLVMWGPFAALLLAALYRRGATTEEERLIVGLGLWILLQAAAVAYGRGASGLAPTSRYMDFLSLGFVANMMALLVALDRMRAGPVATRVAIGAFAAWLLFAIVGADRLTVAAAAELDTWKPYFAAHEANVRAYLIANDRPAFLSKRPLVDLPYPDAERLASYLDYPDILRILPAPIRKPVRLTPLLATGNAFVPDGSPMTMTTDMALTRMWGSYGEKRRASEGRFESRPMPSCKAIGRLQFQVSGYLGMPNQYLAVKDLRSGREVAVRPSTIPRESWLRVAVPCPAGPFSIVAVDAAPDSWFAFREPVEVGWASLWAEWLIARSRALLLISLSLAVLAIRWGGRESSGRPANT